MTGWLALVAFVAAVFVVVAGIARPGLLEVAEPVLCSRSGQTLGPTEGNGLDNARSAVDKDYAVFCTSDSLGIQDVTGRWFMLWIGLVVAGGLLLTVRAKVTPPTLRAPVLPVGR